MKNIKVWHTDDLAHGQIVRSRRINEGVVERRRRRREEAVGGEWGGVGWGMGGSQRAELSAAAVQLLDACPLLTSTPVCV